MAVSAPVGASGLVSAGLTSNCPTSVVGMILEAVTDATATAASAAELISPMTFAGTNCRWIKVGENCGRIELRAKYHVSTDMTTPPIVYVIGATVPVGTTPANQFATDGTVPFERLDAFSGVAGITLTRTAATDQKSTANRYTPWYSYTHPTTGAIGDLNGCNWVLVLCSQASIGGTGVVEAKFLN